MPLAAEMPAPLSTAILAPGGQAGADVGQFHGQFSLVGWVRGGAALPCRRCEAILGGAYPRPAPLTSPRGDPVRRRLLLSLALLLSAAAAAAGGVPVVRFSWDSEASAGVARRAGGGLGGRGPGPGRSGCCRPDAPADTVDCLVAGSAEFTRLFAGTAPDWGVGLAFPNGRAVAIDRERLPAVGRGAREVFLHEMVHALLFQGAGGAWLPTWFHEGAAMEVSGEWRFVDTVSLALAGRVPQLGRLQGAFPGGRRHRRPGLPHQPAGGAPAQGAPR